MAADKIWRFVKADQFFAEYLPHMKTYKHRIRGFNGRGNPTQWTDAEKKEIQKAVMQLIKDIKNPDI